MLVIESVFLIYFIYVAVYALTLSIAGKFYKMPEVEYQKEFSTFGVFIPAYKEDGVIVEIAKSALEQKYPKDKYTVIVIADSLKEETVSALKKLPIQVIEVSFDKSTKVKSLNRAFEIFDKPINYAVILDSDNIMESNFLSRMNGCFNPETNAIQGQRKAKNKENTMAFLDGLSEAINNHIYRQGTHVVGLSASISGSGVAFNYKILKNKLASMTSVGGFDRELEVLLLEDGILVKYLKDAIVYDEKVSSVSTFQHQRKRWISSQFIYLKKYLAPGLKALFRWRFAYFNSAVLRNIQLPRLINLGLLTIFTLISFLLSSYVTFSPFLWLLIFLLFILSMALAIPREYFTKQLVKSILTVPIIFGKMFLLLFKLKGANKSFIHTPHMLTKTENRTNGSSR